MWTGTIIENSLEDKSILNEVEIVKSWESTHWKLYDIHIEESKALEFGKYLADGPWYVHFWEPGKDEVLVVFKNKHFKILHSDQNTWADAIQYGESVGIPKEQLDFVIT